MTETKTAERAQPEAITAVPVRHPGRWVAIVVLAIVAAMFVHMLVTNDAFQWQFMLDNMFRPPVLEGVRTSLILTVLAMIIGVTLGIVIAMMRLSPNPILSGAAWLYTWFFRAVPRIVLLILFGNLGILYGALRVRAAVRPPARQPVRDRPRRPPVRPRRPDHPDRLHGRPAGAGPVRGGLHGRDRAGGHEGGRPGPAGGGPRPRHGARARPCAGSSCPRRCG